MVAFLVPLGIQAAARAAPFAARFAKPALKFGYEGLKKGNMNVILLHLLHQFVVHPV